jgi:hypothetical protein
MVFQLVSMPPSQRWLTKCWPERAASAIGFLRLALGADEQNLAARLPTVAETKSSARANSGTVCDRSRM